MNSPHINRPRKRYGGSGLLALCALLFCTLSMAISASAQPFQAVSATLVAESCLPANNSFDPGETNTVTFVIRNVSGGDLANVRATLVPNERVGFVSGQQIIGALANNASANVTFSFITLGNCAENLNLTLNVTRDGGPEGGVNLDYGQRLIGSVVSASATFSNTAAITINDTTTPPSAPPTRATPYPSQITVANVPLTVSKVTVSLNALSHTFGQDVDVMVVSPTGEKIVLMSDVGGAATPQINNATFVFDADAASQIPASGQIVGGVFRPTNYPVGPEDVFPSPAPAGPYTDALTALAQKNPNGVWSLYVVDDQAGDAGVIAGGWSLNITTNTFACCIAGFPIITPIANRIGDNAVDEDVLSPQIPFTLRDFDTPLQNLTVTATSANQLLIPNANIVLTGAGTADATRTIQYRGATNQFGTTTITVLVTDPQGRTASTTFLAEIRPINDPPTISAIPNQSANRGGETPFIPFTVGDVEFDPAFLTVTFTSSNEALVPLTHIFLGGAGANRTIKVQAATADAGQTTITLTVSDGSATASTSFVVAFDIAPGFPTVTPISTVTTPEDTAATVSFQVGDANTPLASLVVTATSSNPTLIPNTAANLTLSGTGATRTLTITPAPNQFGSATISLQVRNAANNVTTREFVVNVTSVNDLPTIAGLPADLTINEDTPSAEIAFVIGDVETPAANLTLTATSTEPSVVPSLVVTGDAAGIRFGGSGANRTIRINPAPNAFGRTTINVTVTDADGGSRTESIRLIVAEVNDPPTVTANFQGAPIPEGGIVILEDSGTNIVQLTNITPGPNEVGQIITITAVSEDPTLIPHPTVTYTSPNQTGSIAFFPATNRFGETFIQVIARDDAGGNDTRTNRFRVTVTPVNDAPTVSDVGPQFTARDQTHTVVVTVADVDNGVNTLALSATATPSGSVQSVFTAGEGSQRSITIIPAPGATGNVTITYTVTDPAGASQTKNFVLTISDQPQNQPPTISTIPEQVFDEDSVGQTTFTVTDEDPASLAFERSSSNPALIPAGNVLIGSGVNANQRTLVIIPLPDQFGEAIITITARDAHPLNPRAASTSFRVVVRPVEDVPSINLVGASSRSTNEDTPITLEFTVSDPETPAGQLNFEIESSNTTIIPIANVVVGGSGGARTLTITPAPNQHGGPVNVTVRVVDAAGLRATMTVAITVNPVNDQPTLAPIADQNVSANAGARAITLTGITTGAPNETQTLTISAVSDRQDIVPNPSISPNVLADLAGGTTATATLTFAPVPSASGTARITVTVTEAGAPANATVTQVFNVNVAPFNNPPVISVIGDQTIPEDTSTQVIPFTVGDVETGAELLIVTAVSSNPSLVPNTPANLQVGGTGAARGIIITPAPNQVGQTTITVTVTDGGGAQTSRSFTLTVTPVEDPPQISTIPNQFTPVNTETQIIEFTVFDPEGTQLVVTGSSDNPTLVPQRNIQFGTTIGNVRQLIVIPARDQTGTANITITARDAANLTASTTFQLRVDVPNTPPTITAISNQLIDENGTTGPIPVTVTDLETASGFLELSATSSNPALIPVSNVAFGGSGQNRTVTVTPLQNQSGTATITVTVSDRDGGTASRTFTVTVQSTNTNPTISQIGQQIGVAGQPIGPISFTISDSETALGFLQVTAVSSSNPALLPLSGITFGGGAGNRTVLLTPVAGQTGTSLVTIRVTDAGGRFAETTFLVTISEVLAVARVDFNQDGRSDIVWQDGFGFVSVWMMDGADRLSAAFFNPANVGDPGWQIVGAADFNGDGRTDLLFQHLEGTLSVWYMNGINQTSPILLNPSHPGDPGWRVVGVGDFNGDGRPDILFQHTNGTLSVWYLNGVDLTSPTLVNPFAVAPGWRVFGVGDFNGDGRSDIAFQHTDGTLSVWYMNGVDQTSPILINPFHPGDAGWRAVGVNDLNNDGRPDLVFQHITGPVSVWFMNGVDLVIPTFLSPFNPGGTWRIVAP